ncbi:MAG: hypothetical protein EZS28_029696 [Streblomastix strix]|uniref:Uncharacterized protein n=1 Tax=Streblomastix strix TaxID=222440 RepID=A0A5J4UX12_9EUKA|nr:MAG: hypothetical protein EZS28_029696 [Streblomastix strix]
MEKERQIEFDKKQLAKNQQQFQPQQSQMEKTQNQQLNTPHKPSSPHLQQHSPSPSLEETLAILRTIYPGVPRVYKERNPEPKEPKLQQYAGLMDVTDKFHEIIKPIVEEERKKLKAMLPVQNKHFPNKDDHFFFFPPKNYRLTPIPRPKDLNLSEEQWEQFDGDVRQGVVPLLFLTKRQP